MTRHNFKRRPVAAIYMTKMYTKARAALIATFRPGQPCVLCGHPIQTTKYVEAQHIPGTDRLLGLCHGTRQPCPVCHKRCNQVDGARRGRARQNTGTTTLRW